MDPEMSLESLIQMALDTADDTLGKVERNCEIKIVYLTLWALGWHPIRDIALGFQVSRDKFGGQALAAKAPDFAVRLDNTIVMLGEAKRWRKQGKGWEKGRKQLELYGAAIPVERSFLTSGDRWEVFNPDGKLLDKIKERNRADVLIAKLRPLIGKESLAEGVEGTSAGDDRSIWKYGLGRGMHQNAVTDFATWDVERYGNTEQAAVISRFRDFATMRSLQCDSGQGLFIRFPNGKKLLEYNPFKPNVYISCPEQDLRDSGVSETLVGKYLALSRQLRRGKADLRGLLGLLNQIIVEGRSKGSISSDVDTGDDSH